MANLTTAYRGFDLNRGNAAPSASSFEFFEDFLGSLVASKIDLGDSDTAIMQYPGVLVSATGVLSGQKPVAFGNTAGGSISFTTANNAVEGLSIPTCLVDVDAGDWFVETRLKINALEANGIFAFGLQEDVSVTDTISQTTGAAGEDVVMMFYDTGTTTDGLLEASITKNTDHTANTNGAAGMTGAQIVSDTFHRLGIRCDKTAGRVYFYFDGKLVDEVASTNLSDQNLHPFILAGHDDMGAITVDYVYVKSDR